jgi:niacin transporter
VPTATLTGTALLLALGVALPLVFHAVPLGGRIFLPMHLPTFVAGLILGPVAGLVVGVGSPVVSSLLTGMPVAPFYMVPMMFELGTYGLVAGLLRPRFEAMLGRAPAGGPGAPASPAGSGSRRYAAVTLSLVCAMIAGRVVWMAVVVWFAPLIGLTARTAAMAVAAIGAGWIGMAIQLALIPAVVRAIERVRGT